MITQMHLPLLESVPNVSVGRDVVRVDGIVDAARDGIARGARLDGSRAIVADVHRDPDHDRSVITIVGSGEALACGLEQLARAAIERIDLRDADGVHPRIGALDVLPIIPLDDDEDSARAAAHGLARRLAGAIGGGLGVPVVRYGLDQQGTRIPGASSTGEVRRGGGARVTERIASGELDLSAGPREPHPSAGVTICGVRDVLLAFNVDLDVDDVGTARAIAARIREVSGGDDALPGVRALGLRLSSRGVVQVSTNVERHRDCGPARVLETVVRIAEEFDGVGVAAAELVGLAPDSALMPLRYACTRLGVPLLAASDPSLDAAVRRVRSA
jgi:glutamate formiminotransferase